MVDARAAHLRAWPNAKISPPSPRALLSRPRLRDAISRAVAAGQVTFIAAPGGSGKTSLLADWARHAAVPVAWYALDPADRDTRRLVSGLCAAVERVLPGVAATALAALDGGAQEAAAIGLLLGALEGQPLALVLDDFQHLDDLPEAVGLWDHLLRFRPPTLALIILSRSIPLFGFSTLAALDELAALGRDDLRFDAAEAAGLLGAHGLHGETVDGMVRRSGGWAAGLLLLARAAPDEMRFLRARADALMEYLGHEMVAALPADVRRFMLESAALGTVSAEETDALLGRSDSAAYYAEVAARGLFLEQRDGLYRYHDLFGDYLVGALRAENQDRLREVRRTAAAHWIEGGDLPRGLALLASNEDWSEVAAVLDRERVTVWAHGLLGTALAYAERLPDDYRTPRLITLAGHAREQRGEYEQALALADRAMAAAAAEEDWLPPAVLRAQVLVRAQRYEETVRSADAALAVAQRVEHVAAAMQLREIRGEASLRLGRIAAGHDDLLAALTVYERDGDVIAQARVLTNLATQLVESGRPGEAEEYLIRAQELWQRIGNSPFLGYVHLTWSLARVLTGDVASAREQVEQALRLARDGGIALLECEAMAAMADIAAQDGNAREAESHGVEAANMAARLDLGPALNTALRARIAGALLRRDRAAARRLIDEARRLAATPADMALTDLLEGTLALRTRSYGRAIDLLDQATPRLIAVNQPHSAARALLLGAEAALVSGRVRRAEDTLNRMSELVRPLGCEGYLRPIARWSTRVLEQRRTLRRLRRDTRLLLEQLDSGTPALTLLPPVDDAVVPPPPEVRLSPFGVGRLEINGAPVDLSVLPQAAREVLFYSVHMGRPVRRDEIIEAVFGGSVAQQVSQALWDASRNLRRLFGESSWGPRGGAYALYCPVVSDEHLFHGATSRALSDARLEDRIDAAETALSLFGAGGYLEWCENLWAQSQRARVGEAAISVACALARLYAKAGRPDDAVAVCRRASVWDPLDEEPRLTMIQILCDIGSMDAALREYQAYRRVLREERIAPSTAMVAIGATLIP